MLDKSAMVLPVSIGTAIAIQAILGYDPEGKPLKGTPAFTQYDTLYLNVRTLIRNFIGAKPNEEKGKITPEEIFFGITADIKIIDEIMTTHAGPSFRVMPYLCYFNDLEKKLPYAAWRTANTEIQKAAKKLEDDALKLIKDKVTGNPNSTLLVFATKLDRYVGANEELKRHRPGNTLILTHMPIDLLSVHHFPRLTLLESHTGKTKDRNDWNTKLKNYKPEMARLPFNPMTLQIFGDTGDMFQPVAQPKAKKRIVELSNKYNWNPLTTMDRMVNCARLDHEVTLAGEMRRLSNRY